MRDPTFRDVNVRESVPTPFYFDFRKGRKINKEGKCETENGPRKVNQTVRVVVVVRRKEAEFLKGLRTCFPGIQEEVGSVLELELERRGEANPILSFPIESPVNNDDDARETPGCGMDKRGKCVE